MEPQIHSRSSSLRVPLNPAVATRVPLPVPVGSPTPAPFSSQVNTARMAFRSPHLAFVHLPATDAPQGGIDL